MISEHCVSEEVPTCKDDGKRIVMPCSRCKRVHLSGCPEVLAGQSRIRSRTSYLDHSRATLTFDQHAEGPPPWMPSSMHQAFDTVFGKPHSEAGQYSTRMSASLLNGAGLG